jgi:hypothetical protein
MAKKRSKRGNAAAGDRSRAVPRRRGRGPVIALSVISLVAIIALTIAGYLSFSVPH